VNRPSVHPFLPIKPKRRSWCWGWDWEHNVRGWRQRVKALIASDPSAVMADITRLHQVLMNLCVNARDAMP
jgi:signal transduction histidine kinase